MMRPTFRTVLAIGAGVPLSLVLILISEALWPYGLAYLALAVIVAGTDGLRTVSRRALLVEITPPDILYIGDTDDLQITLTVAGRWPGTSVDVVCDVGSNLETPPQQSAALVSGSPTRLSVPLVPMLRGTAEIYRVWLRVRGPWNLVVKQWVQPVSASLAIVPNIRAVRQAAIQFSSRDALFGFKPQSQQGDGSEFEALREYVPGLNHRTIDWKHSARHRKLVCREYRAERNHQIVLAFDTGHLMGEPLNGIPKLDHAINAGLLLSYMSLRNGDRIGVFGFDSQVRVASEPVGGAHNFSRLQRASAGLEYRHEETNFTLGLTELMGQLNRRALVILQTEFVDTITAELMVENLQRLAARHFVVFVTLQDPSLHSLVDAPPRKIGDVTRSVIASDFIRERLIVFERLRRLGVHCLDAPSGRIGADLINQYLLIKRQELI